MPETHFFSTAMVEIGKSGDEPLAEDEVDKIVQALAFKMELDPAMVQELGEAELGTGKEIFEYLVSLFRPAVDGSELLRVVEKTPVHAKHMEEIVRLYPDARFIHIIRDPRDAIPSYMKVLPNLTTNWLPYYISEWMRVMKSLEEAANEEQVHVIRYEDLTSDSERVLQSVCSFLDLDYEGSMLTDFQKEYRHNVLASETDWKYKVKSGEIINEEGRWRTTLHPGRAWLISVYTDHYLKMYYYSRFPSAKIWDKVLVVIGEMKIGFREGQPTVRWLRGVLSKLTMSTVRRVIK